MTNAKSQIAHDAGLLTGIRIRIDRTMVRWELTATKTGTILKVTHSGLVPLNLAKDYGQGWPGLVEQIKNFVEK